MTSRISWFPFIAWEENRLGGEKNKTLWVDTPEKVHRTDVSRGKVGTLKSFLKGTSIPEHLRPTGAKILWVLLETELVRKVFVDDNVVSETRYIKAKLPMHPFIVSNEIPNSGKENREVIFHHPLRTVTIIVNKSGPQKITVKWKTEGDGYSLPSVSSVRSAGNLHQDIPVKEKPSQAPVNPLTYKAKPSETAKKNPPIAFKPIRRTKIFSSPEVSSNATKDEETTTVNINWKPDNQPSISYSSTVSSPKWEVKTIEGKTVVTLLQQGRYRDGLNLSIKKRKIKPHNYEVLFLEGIATAWCGNLKRALVLLEKADEMNRSFKAPTIEIALIKAIEGKAHEALGILSSFKDIDKTDRYHFVLGATLYIMRNIEEAYEAAKKGSRDPDSFESFFLAGKCASLLGQKSIARDYYRQLMADCPINYHTLLPLAILKSPAQPNDLKHPSIVEKQPVRLLLHTSVVYGVLEYAEENYPRATEGFTKACLLKPECPEYIFNCALSLEKSSKIKEAISMYKRLLSSDQYKEIARNKLTELTTTEEPEISFVDKYGSSSRKNLLSSENIERSNALDSLFNSVKANIAKATGEPTNEREIEKDSPTPDSKAAFQSKLSSKLENIRTVTSINYGEKASKVTENIVSGHRNEGTELRYGGKGEQEGLKETMFRLSPQYDFPMMLNKNKSDSSFSYSLDGHVATGNFGSINIELTAESAINKSWKLQTSRFILPDSPTGEEKSVSLSLTTPLLDNEPPIFSLSITAVNKDSDVKTTILKSTTRISYGSKP
jgi:tetratricopeptide (TPR) repeat protein